MHIACCPRRERLKNTQTYKKKGTCDLLRKRETIVQDCKHLVLSLHPNSSDDLPVRENSRKIGENDDFPHLTMGTMQLYRYHYILPENDIQH